MDLAQVIFDFSCGLEGPEPPHHSNHLVRPNKQRIKYVCCPNSQSPTESIFIIGPRQKQLICAHGQKNFTLTDKDLSSWLLFIYLLLSPKYINQFSSFSFSNENGYDACKCSTKFCEHTQNHLLISA